MRFCIMTKNEEVKKDFEFISKEISDKKLFFIENDTQNALKDITTYDLDYIFTDISLPEVDGFDFIEDVKRKRSECKIIVISNVKNQTIVNMAREMGIIDYITLPIDFTSLYKYVLDLFKKSNTPLDDSIVRSIERFEKESHTLANKRKSKSEDKILDEKISNIFISIGIPPHIRGYHYLREGVKIAVKNPVSINSITKVLYPEIAKAFDSSSTKVERAMRHAIESAWSRGKMENLNTFLGIKVYTKGQKPTNGEFIALISDKLLLEGI